MPSPLFLFFLFLGGGGVYLIFFRIQRPVVFYASGSVLYTCLTFNVIQLFGTPKAKNGEITLRAFLRPTEYIETISGEYEDALVVINIIGTCIGSSRK